MKQEADALFKDNKGIQDDVTYPLLEVYKKNFEKIIPVLGNALAEATEGQLDKKIDMGEEQNITFYDFPGFFIYQEANIIGQLALWRRLLDYPSMKYM